jgi:hypothetical protein
MPAAPCARSLLRCSAPSCVHCLLFAGCIFTNLAMKPAAININGPTSLLQSSFLDSDPTDAPNLVASTDFGMTFLNSTTGAARFEGCSFLRNKGRDLARSPNSSAAIYTDDPALDTFGFDTHAAVPVEPLASAPSEVFLNATDPDLQAIQQVRSQALPCGRWPQAAV